MQVKIDRVKNTVEVINPITGKIEKAELVKSLIETDTYDLKASDDLMVANQLIAKLQVKVNFLKSKLTTLSINDWNSYSEI